MRFIPSFRESRSISILAMPFDRAMLTTLVTMSFPQAFPLPVVPQDNGKLCVIRIPFDDVTAGADDGFLCVLRNNSSEGKMGFVIDLHKLLEHLRLQLFQMGQETKVDGLP